MQLYLVAHVSSVSSVSPFSHIQLPTQVVECLHKQCICDFQVMYNFLISEVLINIVCPFSCLGQCVCNMHLFACCDCNVQSFVFVLLYEDLQILTICLHSHCLAIYVLTEFLGC